MDGGVVIVSGNIEDGGAAEIMKGGRDVAGGESMFL